VLSSLEEAVDELELALASSAAAVAGAVGGYSAVGRVSRFYARLVSAPPAVRLLFLLLLASLFLFCVYVLNFYGGEEEENEDLLAEGVLFKRDAVRVEVEVVSHLQAAGAGGQAVAEAISAENAVAGAGDGGLTRLLEQEQPEAVAEIAAEGARRLMRWGAEHALRRALRTRRF